MPRADASTPPDASTPADTNPPAPAALAPPPGTPVPRTTTGDRSTWERVSLSPDVELHVRRPLDRRANKQVERLVRIAHELFEEDA